MNLINHNPKEVTKVNQLSEQPIIHASAVIVKSYIGKWIEIGEKAIIMESSVDDFSYIASSYTNFFFSHW